MPTYARTASFKHDHASLTPDQKAAFRQAVDKFIEDLTAGKFRKSLRIKGVKGARNIYEMTWADDGRATFQYGSPQIEGEKHVIWRRVGTHDIFGNP